MEESGNVQKKLAEEEARVVRKNYNTTTGVDGVVNEAIKFGGEGMIKGGWSNEYVWGKECAPSRCKEGIMLNLFKRGGGRLTPRKLKGDQQALLSVVKISQRFSTNGTYVEV